METKNHTILCKITNVEQFFRMIDQCKKSVFIKSPCGEIKQLRKNVWLQLQMFWTNPIGRLEKVELWFDSEEDMKNVMYGIKWI